MSDTSRGPGWWQAPDGKWFSPQTPPFIPQEGSPTPPESPGPGFWQAPDGLWFPLHQPPFHPAEASPPAAPDIGQHGSTPAATGSSGDPWYQRTWVVVAALIVAFPVGLVLMWLSGWKMPTKIIVTSGVAVLAVVTLATSSPSPKNTPSAWTETSTTEPPTTTGSATTTTTTEPPTTTVPPTTALPPVTAPPATGIRIGPGPQASYIVQPQPAPGSCHYTYAGADPLPDPHCTPGAINPQVTQGNIGSTICRSGYTTIIRPPESVTGDEKVASAAAYGYTGSLHTAEYDHLISLELGGDPNDPANLWVEPNDRPSTTSTYNSKDSLENKLKSLVCSGQISLATAQLAIATNWVVAYQQYDS